MSFSFTSKPPSPKAPSPDTLQPIRIIGVGNPLMGDDGAGIAVLELLRQEPLPAGVEVVDGGTGGLTLLTLMAGAAAVIVADAVDGGRPPGTLLRLAGEALLPASAPAVLSVHAAGLPEVLALGRELGELPPLVLHGVQPLRVAPGVGLSAPVAAALPALAAALLAEVHTLGNLSAETDEV